MGTEPPISPYCGAAPPSTTPVIQAAAPPVGCLEAITFPTESNARHIDVDRHTTPVNWRGANFHL